MLGESGEYKEREKEGKADSRLPSETLRISIDRVDERLIRLRR